jgi:hypothetical protein
MGFLGKFGGAFKFIGNKLRWLAGRNELLIAVSFLPVPALDKIIILVRSLDRQNLSGAQKMEKALEKVIPILREFGIEGEADARFAIELALRILKRKAVVNG